MSIRTSRRRSAIGTLVAGLLMGGGYASMATAAPPAPDASAMAGSATVVCAAQAQRVAAARRVLKKALHHPRARRAASRKLVQAKKTLAACRAAAQTSPPPVAVKPNAADVPTGYYGCYHTAPTSDGYATTFMGALTLHDDATYDVSFKGVTGKWTSASGNAMTFAGGAFDDDANGEHDHGVYAPGGTTMPHDQTGNQYTIVIQGSAGNADTAPPATESDTAITGTYWYCRLRA